MFYICSMSGVHVIWFKRDLRVHDHAALAAAVASGAPILPLYIFEPGYWALPEHSRRQFDFVRDSLEELDAALKARGTKLVIRMGSAIDVFSALHQKHGIAAIHAHEETGLQWTFDRDRAVRRWARNAGISLREQPQNGVQRALQSRDGWANQWEAFMRRPRLVAPEALKPSAADSEEWPLPQDFGLGADDCPQRQKGGRMAAVDCLRSFLESRGRTYQKSMSSPLTAADACSRLSPHLAFGTVSIREAWQAAQKAQHEHGRSGDTGFAASIGSFISRLQWHCHFIQKLEDQTSIESRNLHPGYDGLRPEPLAGDPRLAAWIEGRTGFPFLDACMRSLRETGWLNFRMRAMVMGFASHHLWLDWKQPAEHLAALFTDFEPGIHYPQAQMQSATTGMNTPRIYNPVKQSQDQDPDGAFIRRWVPELSGLPAEWLHAPWEAPASVRARAGIVLGQTYPMRIVDHMAAAEEARSRIFAVRKRAGHGAQADALQARHGSKRSGIPFRGQQAARRQAVPRAPEPAQLSFDLHLTPPSQAHAS
ncbi:deoxyribodipyrimidine photolyase family protein [Hyphomonas neptunium ATCC 15444]|uniref:Deoxyribodipyrimidine photolyase family protein n=3 Tax=Hyphomonadaceae TaxID=69657 RepID=Q0BXN5_HYPNA|nr:deoxyribodipyrimidine photolyase family protein [Hyphomonas neptunium ATCC 15444]KCZ93553.1 deoxyribodipyrimidine photolyase family protein [Hyphomonas hirschiana VP5]